MFVYFVRKSVFLKGPFPVMSKSLLVCPRHCEKRDWVRAPVWNSKKIRLHNLMREYFILILENMCFSKSLTSLWKTCLLHTMYEVPIEMFSLLLQFMTIHYERPKFRQIKKVQAKKLVFGDISWIQFTKLKIFASMKTYIASTWKRYLFKTSEEKFVTTP